MAVRINSLKRTPAAPTQTPREAMAGIMRAFIADDDLLSRLMPPDHPLFVYEPLNLSSSLTFKVSYRHAPHQAVVGCIPVFSLKELMHDPDRTTIPFYSVVRSLLFWLPGLDLSRENLRLLDPVTSEIEWPAVQQFLLRALHHLPIDATFEQAEAELTLHLSPRSPLEALPLSLRLNTKGLQATYGPAVHERGLVLANEAFKDTLLIQLSRALISLMTPEQAV